MSQTRPAYWKRMLRNDQTTRQPFSGQITTSISHATQQYFSKSEKRLGNQRQIIGTNSGFRSAIFGSIVWKCYGKNMLKSSVIFTGSFGIHNVSICLWENPETLVSMISGFGTFLQAPKPIMFHLWKHTET